MKKLNIVFVLMIISNIVYSQEIKTYKGLYNYGFAEFEYIENGIDRELDGKFLFFNKLDTIRCNYLKNKLSGNYSRKKYIEVDVKKPNDYNSIMVKKLLSSSEGEIKNQNKNGIWKYSECINCSGDDFYYHKIEYLNNLNKFTVNFNNDTITGEIDNSKKNSFFIKGEFDLKGRFTGTIYQGKKDTLDYINKYDIYKSVLYSHIEIDKLKNKYLKIYKLDLENIKKITKSDAFYVNEKLSKEVEDLNNFLFSYFEPITESVKLPIDSDEYQKREIERKLNWYYFERIRTLIY